MTKKEKKEELHLDENDLTAWIENKIGHLKPYTSHIALAVALAFAGFMAITYFINARQTAYADQWRELSLANTDLLLNQNTSRLLNVAEDYPNQRAAMWSLQIVGDSDLQTGLSKVSYDREQGFIDLKRAKTNLQKVVDASNSIKSESLQKRALFSMAYTCESLGEFEEARKYYQQLIDEFPDSAFAPPAQRGLNRTNNPELIALYDTFKEWKDISAEAPGPTGPTIPNLDFDDLDIDAINEPNASKDDFGTTDESASADKPEKNEETTTAALKNVSTEAVDESSPKTEAADDGPQTVEDDSAPKKGESGESEAGEGEGETGEGGGGENEKGDGNSQ